MPARRLQVVIADDYAPMVTALRRLLSAECDVVETVADGAALLESVARLQPDVVVADLNLPSVSGLEACREIVKANSGIRVILLTGVPDDAVRQRAIAAGAHAFIGKALAPDLLEAIKEVSEEA
jgi:DNA-binding NarL/FixJ family response regulator